MSAVHQSDANPSVDAYISAAVRALMAARDVKADVIADVIGSSRRPVFAKLGGTSPWKASEVQALSDYFDVTVGDLYNGLGLIGDTKKPHRLDGEASFSGAPSGTRTPDPLIKSQLL